MIDPTALKRIEDLENRSGAPLFKTLVSLFSQEALEGLEDVRNAFAKNDLKSLCLSVHSLKSASENLGALRLRNLSEEIEMLNPNVPTQQIRFMIQTFEEELALVLEELRHLAMHWPKRA